MSETVQERTRRRLKQRRCLQCGSNQLAARSVFCATHRSAGYRFCPSCQTIWQTDQTSHRTTCRKCRREEWTRYHERIGAEARKEQKARAHAKARDTGRERERKQRARAERGAIPRVDARRISGAICAAHDDLFLEMHNERSRARRRSLLIGLTPRQLNHRVDDAHPLCKELYWREP